MYADGDGVPQNEMLSEKYMREAAINGVPQAQVIEGKRYKAGKNTSVDPIIAYAYFNVAASVESPIKSEAINLRDSLITTFSNDDKVIAQTLSTQFSTIGILKALDQYIVEVKKRENEALAAKIAAEKTAQEEAAREAERIAHEEKIALIIDWAKKIGFVILGLITVGGLGFLIRKHFKTHKSATEFLRGAKVDEGISAIKDKTTKFANVIASDIQTIKEGGHSAMEESQKTDLPSTDQKISAVKILWSKLNFQQRLILLLPIIVVAFILAKSFGGHDLSGRSELKTSAMANECVTKNIMPDKPIRRSNGEYTFLDNGHGFAISRLIQNGSYSIVEAELMDGFCLVTLDVNGVIDGNSYSARVQVGAF